MKLNELINILNDFKEIADIKDENPDVEIQHNTPYNVDRNIHKVEKTKLNIIILK